MSAEARTASPGEAELRAALARLEADGFIVSDPPSKRWRTSRRWQRAMARAAVKLYQQGDEGGDLRVPIALALVELSSARPGDDDETLARLVEAMLPIEVDSLGLRRVR